MKTVKLEVDIPPSRELRLVLPDDVPAGPSTVTLLIDTASERLPRDLPAHDFGPWPEQLSLRREDLYGDDGR